MGGTRLHRSTHDTRNVRGVLDMTATQRMLWGSGVMIAALAPFVVFDIPISLRDPYNTRFLLGWTLIGIAVGAATYTIAAMFEE